MIPVALRRSLAAAVAFGAAACGGSYEFSTTTGTSTPRTAAAGGGALPPFLDLVETAKDSTAFRGIRRFRSVNGIDVLEVREDVGADGTGEFAIELLETISLPPDFEPTSFPVTYENAARFRWRMRDFRIRDLDRVERSYSIFVLPQRSTVAGISCARVEFFRNDPLGGRPGHYEVDIDPETGFVLAWREFDDLDQVIVESVYETFEYGGDLGGLNVRGRSFVAQSLNLSGNLTQQAGVDVLFPDVFPEGFEVVSGEVMDVPTTITVDPDAFLQPGQWIRFVATDGIETITFMHAEAQVATAATTGEIKLFRLGTWELGSGELAGTKYAIAGRIDQEDLRLIVQSAF